MQILSLQLKNIKSHRETRLDFSAGINVLSGRNGAGKSTVFEAIGYALFGVDARDFVGNADRFVTFGERRGEVAVVFRAVDGDVYRATRTVGAPAKWLLAREVGGDFEVEEHASLEETEGRLKELLGLENGRTLADQFKLVIGPLQNEFLGPFIAKGAKRQTEFDQILGIDAWRKTLKGTLDLANVITAKISILKAEIGAKQEQVAVLPAKEQELAEKRSLTAKKSEELKEQAVFLEAADKRLSDLESQKIKLDTLSADLKLTEGNINAGGEYIEKQKKVVEQSETAAKTVAANKPGKERYDRVENDLKALRNEEGESQRLEKIISELDKERAAVDASRVLEAKELAEQQVALAEEAKRIEEEETALNLRLQDAQKQESLLKDSLAEFAKEELLFRELHIHSVNGVLPYVKTALNQVQRVEAQIAQKQRELEHEGEILEVAAKLPELKLQLEALRNERSQLAGRKENLLDGKEKLAGGNCPFLNEPCLNIAAGVSNDLFAARMEEIDSFIAALDTKIVEYSETLKGYEQADRDAVVLNSVRNELVRLGQDRDKLRSELANHLDSLSIEKLRSSLDTWLENSGLGDFHPEERNGLALSLVGEIPEQLQCLERLEDNVATLLTALKERFEGLKAEAEAPLHMVGKELAALRADAEQIKKRRAELEAKRKRVGDREKNLMFLQGRLAEVDGKLAVKRGEMARFIALPEKIAAAEKDIADHKPAHDLFLANIKMAEELSRQAETLAKYQKRLQELEIQRTEQARALDELRSEYKIELHEEAKKAREKLNVSVITLKEELKSLDRDMTRIDAEVSQFIRVKEEIEGRLRDVADLEEKEKLVKYLRSKVFNNVSKQLSERFREEISQRADRIYRTIAEADEELIWGENYQVILRDMVDGALRERTDDQLSGGQMMSAVVALRLALLQTIGARVAFFDEPTSNLDALRRENLAQAFRAIDHGQEEVTEHWYDQLFLISHDVAFTEITDQITQLGD